MFVKFPESETQHPVVITRRKAGGEKPKASDTKAWKRNGSPEPEEVFRSIFYEAIFHQTEWVTKAQYEAELRMLRGTNIPFKSRHSRSFITHELLPGHLAWFNVSVESRLRVLCRICDFKGTKEVVSSRRVAD